MLCMMAQGEPYGHLQVKPNQAIPFTPRPPSLAPGPPEAGHPAPPYGLAHGTPSGTPSGLPSGGAHCLQHAPENGSLEGLIWSFASMTAEEVAWCVADLERQGVFSRTPDGIIYSRRMVRDHLRHEARVKKAVAAYAERHQNQQTQVPRPPKSVGAPPGPPVHARPDGVPDALPSGTPSGLPSGLPHGGAYNQNYRRTKDPTPPPPPPRGGGSTPSARREELRANTAARIRARSKTA